MSSQFEIGATIDQTGVGDSADVSGSGSGKLLPQTRLVPGSMLPGTRLKIVRWLGQGGMGVVFEVRHLDIERRYAAKLLNLAATPKRARRFHDEARTISQLGSPYIVEVFDFKQLPNGQLLFLMELIEGPSLSQECAEHGPLDLARLIGLARQVCKGLHDAHEQGFVHRDVKPDNIVLGRARDGREQIKLVDFGLATLRGNRRSRSRGGTPAYMSPEQAQGLPTEIRSDIYSFGASLYELSTGTLPFFGDDEATLRRLHIEETPEPPSSRVEGSFSPELEALILKCMAKDPEARYASAVELEAALIELQIGLGLRTPWDDLRVPQLEDERRQRQLVQGMLELRGRDKRRQRRQWSVGAGLVLALGIASVLGYQAQIRAREQQAAAEHDELAPLRERAEMAASHARWVYPRVGDPEAETAYRVVLAIETRPSDAARSLGAELREEFTTTLVALGDTYWDAEGGRSFAAEFYAQAAIFSPEHERARARSGLRTTELMLLRNQAETGNFERYELDAMRPLQTLAQAEGADRRAGLEELLDEPGQLSARQAAKVEKLLSDPVVVADAGPRPEPEKRGEGLVGASEAEAEAEVEGTGETGGTEDMGETGEAEATEPEALEAIDEPGAEDKGGGSKESSAKLVRSAQKAYDAGRSDDAERLYRKALARNAKDVDALVGLHRIHFDRRDYRKALDFAQRAAKVKPKRGQLHMYVGDSCAKIFDWTCARKHYNTALSLGVSRAKSRLEFVDEQSGK